MFSLFLDNKILIDNVVILDLMTLKVVYEHNDFIDVNTVFTLKGKSRIHYLLQICATVNLQTYNWWIFKNVQIKMIEYVD